MNYSETPNLEKKQLKEVLSKHEKALKKEVKSFSQNTEGLVADIVLVGTVLLIAYLTISRLVSDEECQKREPKDDENKKNTYASAAFSQITETIVNQAIVALLDIVKEKLSKYLHTKSQYEQTDHTTAKKQLK